MIFRIQNTTGNSIVYNGVTYPNGSYVPIENIIAFRGIRHSRNDIDGPNAGRNLVNGGMIRDRRAKKNKWDVTLKNAVEASEARLVYTLVDPQTFVIMTDYPYGELKSYNCYTNNVSTVFELLMASGIEYFSGITIPIVEV